LQYISGTVKNSAEVPSFGVCGFGTWTLLAQDFVGQEQYVITPGGGFDGDSNGPQAAFRALMVAGVVDTMPEGVEEAAEAIDKGLANTLLNCWVAY
jgi:hypothetical protein